MYVVNHRPISHLYVCIARKTLSLASLCFTPPTPIHLGRHKFTCLYRPFLIHSMPIRHIDSIDGWRNSRAFVVVSNHFVHAKWQHKARCWVQKIEFLYVLRTPVDLFVISYDSWVLNRIQRILLCHAERSVSYRTLVRARSRVISSYQNMKLKYTRIFEGRRKKKT